MLRKLVKWDLLAWILSQGKEVWGLQYSYDRCIPAEDVAQCLQTGNEWPEAQAVQVCSHLYQWKLLVAVYCSRNLFHALIASKFK